MVPLLPHIVNTQSFLKEYSPIPQVNKKLFCSYSEVNLFEEHESNVRFRKGSVIRKLSIVDEVPGFQL